MSKPPPANSSSHFFATEGLDRADHLRGDEAWLAARLDDPESLLVPVWRDKSLVAGWTGPEAEVQGWPARDEEAAGGRDCLNAGLVPVGRAQGLLAEHRRTVFLGISEGRALFALDVSDSEDPAAVAELTDTGKFVGLRRAGPFLGRFDGGLLAYAKAMIRWHRQTRFCGACGSTTRSEEAGHWLRCTSDECGALHFPRTDPAIIVRVTHSDRCLLGRRVGWPPGRYSVLAGFVEPGEALEDAVRREVLEESGIVVGEVSYHSSQPWPFPASLMIGFTAEALSEKIAAEEEELEEVRWFTREEIVREMETGELTLPPEISLARQLIDGWRRGNDR